MAELKRHYLVICEGDSEVAYIQMPNRYLLESGQSIVFSAKNASGGNLKQIRRTLRGVKWKRETPCVMVDRDVYERNERKVAELYEKEKNNLPAFLFQYFNFEDFLVMHCSSEIVVRWRSCMDAKGHFGVCARPLTEEDYMPEFLAFVKDNARLMGFDPNYQKGDMPFELTDWRLKNLFKNNLDSKLPRSDFATFLKGLVTF